MDAASNAFLSAGAVTPQISIDYLGNAASEGRGIRITDPDDRSTTYQYDIAGDNVLITHPDGATEQITSTRIRSALTQHRNGSFPNGHRPVYGFWPWNGDSSTDNQQAQEDYEDGLYSEIGLTSGADRKDDELARPSTYIPGVSGYVFATVDELVISEPLYGLRTGRHINELGHETEFWTCLLYTSDAADE